MEARSGSVSTALEGLERQTRKLVGNACGTHARIIKVGAALGITLLLFSFPSDALAPLRQWMIHVFEAEYRDPGQSGLERGDASFEASNQTAHDAAIRVALAHVGPIRLGGSRESSPIFWTISERMSTPGEYQTEHYRASSDLHRSGFTAVRGLSGARGQQSRTPLLAFGLTPRLYPSHYLPGIVGPAEEMLAGGSHIQTDAGSQPRDNSRGAEMLQAPREGTDGDKNPRHSGPGADGGPLGAPKVTDNAGPLGASEEELPTDNSGSPGDPVATGDNPNGTVPPVSVLDDGLVDKIDESVLQDLSLPHDRGIANPSIGEEGYPDLTRLRVTDESVVAATSIPLPGTLALIVLALPMLVCSHGRLALKRRQSPLFAIRRSAGDRAENLGIAGLLGARSRGASACRR